MRVLFVTGEFAPLQGGVGDCTGEIARAVAARGVDATVLTSTAPGAPAEETRDGIRIERKIGRWGWGSIAALRDYAADAKADVVHIQYQTGAFGMHPAINVAPRVLQNASIFVTTFHDLRVPYLFPKAGRVRDWITYELARSSRAAIATNEEDYARLVEHGINPTLIPIGSNIETAPPADYDREAWRAGLGISKDELLLSYFGFLNESKGGETLVRALALLPQARLVMIGGQVGASDPTNYAYLTRVKALIEELGLSERVIWTGFRPASEVSADFLASDVCVLPFRDGASYRRGSLMAALAHGLPVVTTRPRLSTGAALLPRLVDGMNVCLVGPDQPQAFASGIKAIAASPDLSERLRAGAKELAGAFTWNRIAEAHLALYNSLGPSPRAGRQY